MTGNLSLLGCAAQGPVQDWALPFLSFNQLCHATLDALLVSHIYYQILIKKSAVANDVQLVRKFGFRFTPSSGSAALQSWRLNSGTQSAGLLTMKQQPADLPSFIPRSNHTLERCASSCLGAQMFVKCLHGVGAIALFSLSSNAQDPFIYHPRQGESRCFVSFPIFQSICGCNFSLHRRFGAQRAPVRKLGCAR